MTNIGIYNVACNSQPLMLSYHTPPSITASTVKLDYALLYSKLSYNDRRMDTGLRLIDDLIIFKRSYLLFDVR